MTAREFAMSNLKHQDLEGMGVQGYTVRKTLEVMKPRNSVIVPYKTPNFLEEAIKTKRFVPDANYEVIPNMKDKNTRSSLPKERRRTIATDAEAVARRSPQPDQGTYKPKYLLTEKRNLGAFNLKGSLWDTSFLAEPCYKGTQNPKFYDANYKLVEPKVKGRSYTKPINVKLDSIPTFMR